MTTSPNQVIQSMKRFFVNETEGRLRAGWRIVLFFLGFAALANAIVFGVTALIGGKPAPGLGREFLLIGSIALVMTVSLPFGRRWLDKRGTRSLGLRWDSLAVKDLIFGYALSGLMASTVFGVLVWTDSLVVESFAWNDSGFVAPLLGYFFVYVLVGWWEELFFRGYLWDNLKDGLGLGIAIVVSCVLYGVVHMVNPNANLLSGTIIVLFGFMRLYGLLSTRQLWLSMGMHMGWNFFQGTVFGFAASGYDAFHLVQHTTSGPSWLTGGDFGPEASLVTIPVVLLALGAMHLWATRVSPEARGLDY